MATRQAATNTQGRRSAGEDARHRSLAGIPVTERRVQLAGVSTAVPEGGDGPPVVLLARSPANAAHWMRVIPGLVTTLRVIAPDLPGHGASAVTDGGALDADRVLAWLGLLARTCASPAAVRRLTPPAQLGYLLLGTAGGALLAAVLAGAPVALYPASVSVGLADQRLAGGLMMAVEMPLALAVGYAVLLRAALRPRRRMGSGWLGI